MFKQIYSALKLQKYKYSTQPIVKGKTNVIFDKNIKELIENYELSPRHHVGVVHRSTIKLPEWIIKGMKNLLEDYPIKTVFEDAKHLCRYFQAKLPPPEKNIIESKYEDVRHSIEKISNLDEANEFNTEDASLNAHNKTMKILKRQINPWSSIEYDTYRGLMYMLARGVNDYAILYKIIKEIQTRDKDFKPKTLLDFGSGIGTVSWVVSEFWPESLKERMCIDISKEINDLAEKIISYADPKIKSIPFHQQYLPIAPVPTFDIVVSSFSLLELPNRKMRIDTLSNLWNKTKKYLVLVEFGTKGGFEVISEARDFLLNLINIQKQRNPEKQAFIFSPCPHEMGCPRRIADSYPCKFEVKFFKTSFGKKLEPQSDRYSYIVFKKGTERNKNENWPRIVRPVLVRSGHSICRMCTPEGKLQEIIFSKGKHKRPLYHCARTSCWGDRLPIEIDTNKEE